MPRLLLFSALTILLASAGWLVNGATADDEDHGDIIKFNNLEPKQGVEVRYFLKGGELFQQVIGANGAVNIEPAPKNADASLILNTDESHIDGTRFVKVQVQEPPRQHKVKKQIEKLAAQARELKAAGDEARAAELLKKMELLKKWKPGSQPNGDSTMYIDLSSGKPVEVEIALDEFAPQPTAKIEIAAEHVEAIPAEDGPLDTDVEHKQAEAETGKGESLKLDFKYPESGHDAVEHREHALQELLRNLDREADELNKLGRRQEAEQRRLLTRQLQQLLEKPRSQTSDKFDSTTVEEQRIKNELELARAKAQQQAQEFLRDHRGLTLRRRDLITVRQSEAERKLGLKIMHLQQAAENLQQAGLEDQADKFRQQVKGLQEQLEVYKEARRRQEREQAELQRHEHEHHAADRHEPHPEIRDLLKDLRSEVRGLRKEIREMHEFIEKRLEGSNVEVEEIEEVIR